MRPPSTPAKNFRLLYIPSCVLRACGTANICHPDTTQPHFDSYHLAEAPAKANAVAPGFTFKLTDAGFNFNTRVSVRELMAGKPSVSGGVSGGVSGARAEGW